MRKGSLFPALCYDMEIWQNLPFLSIFCWNLLLLRDISTSFGIILLCFSWNLRLFCDSLMKFTFFCTRLMKFIVFSWSFWLNLWSLTKFVVLPFRWNVQLFHEFFMKLVVVLQTFDEICGHFIVFWRNFWAFFSRSFNEICSYFSQFLRNVQMFRDHLMELVVALQSFEKLSVCFMIFWQNLCSSCNL